MQKKTSTELLLAVVIAIVALVVAAEVMAQESDTTNCTLKVYDKISKSNIEFTIAPIPRNGQFPFTITEPTVINGLTLTCPNNENSCLVAPYSVTSAPSGRKLTELWISYPVNGFTLIGIGGESQPSGYSVYPPCNPASYFRSCLETSVRITFQLVSPHRFALYFKQMDQDALLGSGTNNMAGTYAGTTTMCPNGVTVPSTEICVAQPGKYDSIARADVESFENVLTRIWRDGNGCGFKIEICTYPSPDPDTPNVCAGSWTEVGPETTAPTVNGIQITDCGKTRGPAGIQTPCVGECKIIAAVNPGWVWYFLYGKWYRICGGYTMIVNNVTYCCDPATGVCAP